MNEKKQVVAPSNATRNATRSVANNNQQPELQVASMTVEERQALMAELKQFQQADVAPLLERKLQLEAELADLNQQILAIKPVEDTLAMYRAVRRAVKTGNTSLEDIAAAAGYDSATVQALLTKHLTGKDGKAPIFTLKDGEYTLTPKTK